MTLRGITWDHPRGYAPLAASVERYVSLRGVRIEWDKRSLKDFGDAPLDTLAKTYDLLIIDHPHVGFASQTRCLLPLDECLPAAVIQTLARQGAGPSHASYFYEGHQWALAIDAAMQTSVLRPDLLTGGLPESWDGVIRLGERLRSRGMSLGVPLCPTDAMASFLTVCASSAPVGGLPFADLAVSRAALRVLSRFASLSPAECLVWNPIALLEHMSTADDIAYCPLAFCYSTYSHSTPGRHRLRFRDIPGARGALLGGTGIAVSSRCTHPAEACDYAAWICGEESQSSFYFEAGGQPANTSVWDDPAADALTDGFFSGTRRTLEASYMRPRHPGFIVFQEKAGMIITSFLRGQTDESTCVSGIQRLYEKTR